MEQRISIVTLGVADLKCSRQFYESEGWKPAEGNTGEIVFFRAGSMVLVAWNPYLRITEDGSIRLSD